MDCNLGKFVGFSYSVVVLAVVTCCAFSSPSYARSSRVDGFLESIKDTPYDFKFLREGISSIAGFGTIPEDHPNAYALYYPNLDFIRIPKQSFDKDGNIKPYDQLADEDFASLVHEVFHAYRARHIDTDDNLLPKKEWMAKRSRELFTAVRRGKRAEVLEEAYAIYIEGVLLQVRKLKADLIQDFSDERQCRTRMKVAEALWSMREKTEISSGYMRNSYLDYGIDGFRLILGLEIHRIVEVDTPINRKDKLWVEQEILDSQFLKPFTEVFAPELTRASCLALANR